MYSCISDGDSLDFAPLRLFDISDPTNPTVISDFSNIDGFIFSQVHDTYVRDDLAYLNLGPSGFMVADFSDPSAPVSMGSLRPSDYLQSGYNHSGWLSEDGSTYFMADEDHGMDLKVLDVTALPDLTVVDTIDAGNESRFSIPHNQIVHGDYLYGSYYYDGLQVWDISDRNNIQRIMHYPTSQIEPRQRFEGAWGVYPFLPSGNILVSDMQEGLFVIEDVGLLSSTEDELVSTPDWTMSPNPSQGLFRIDAGFSLHDTEIRIHDLNGRLIQSFDGQQQALTLPAGQYKVSVISPDFISTKTLVIVP